jgi:hypothetical protein
MQFRLLIRWRKESVAISEWLDEKEAKNLDVSQITLPENLFGIVRPETREPD